MEGATLRYTSCLLSQMFLTSLAWKKQEVSENNASPGWSLSFVLGISSDRGSRGCISISHLDSSTSLSHFDLTFQCLAYRLRRVPSYCVELHVLTLLPFPRNLPLVSPSFSRFSKAAAVTKWYEFYFGIFKDHGDQYAFEIE